MGYNRKSLQEILDYCRSCGDLKTVEMVLGAAKAAATTEISINRHSAKDIQRLQRNLYKVLWYYPQYKQFISLKALENELVITIGKNISRRGRPKK